ncbi:hypothetical protein EDC01DRAFT_631089 [Geopyxis carbonaria]|nr:hypothetical protein EDC01DRAFT_631089 [Geopyxis carbonaria]
MGNTSSVLRANHHQPTSGIGKKGAVSSHPPVVEEPPLHGDNNAGDLPPTPPATIQAPSVDENARPFAPAPAKPVAAAGRMSLRGRRGLLKNRQMSGGSRGDTMKCHGLWCRMKHAYQGRGFPAEHHWPEGQDMAAPCWGFQVANGGTAYISTQGVRMRTGEEVAVWEGGVERRMVVEVRGDNPGEEEEGGEEEGGEEGGEGGEDEEEVGDLGAFILPLVRV